MSRTCLAASLHFSIATSWGGPCNSGTKGRGKESDRSRQIDDEIFAGLPLPSIKIGADKIHEFRFYVQSTAALTSGIVSPRMAETSRSLFAFPVTNVIDLFSWGRVDIFRAETKRVGSKCGMCRREEDNIHWQKGEERRSLCRPNLACKASIHQCKWRYNNET